MTLAVALQFDGNLIYRNVRPLSMILEEFEEKGIEHVHVDPAKIKYGVWDLVLVFNDEEIREKFVNNEVEYNADWFLGKRVEKQRINPLKAAKRAARRR